MYLDMSFPKRIPSRSMAHNHDQENHERDTEEASAAPTAYALITPQDKTTSCHSCRLEITGQRSKLPERDGKSLVHTRTQSTAWRLDVSKSKNQERIA